MMALRTNRRNWRSGPFAPADHQPVRRSFPPDGRPLMSRTIAIFGAGPGLGASIARRFAADGFRVALIARNAERLDALVEQLAAEGIEATGFPADLAAPEEIPALISAVRERFGRIDV